MILEAVLTDLGRDLAREAVRAIVERGRKPEDITLASLLSDPDTEGKLRRAVALHEATERIEGMR